MCNLILLANKGEKINIKSKTKQYGGNEDEKVYNRAVLAGNLENSYLNLLWVSFLNHVIKGYAKSSNYTVSVSTANERKARYFLNQNEFL